MIFQKAFTAQEVELLGNLSARALRECGVKNITEDGGIRSFQLLILFKIQANQKRQGCDAFDIDGETFQFKTWCVTTQNKGFSTSAHLTRKILEQYRNTNHWVFGICDETGYLLKEAYYVETKDLLMRFQDFERMLDDRKAQGRLEELNDRKIPLSLVLRVGKKIDSSKIGDNLSTKEIIKVIKNDNPSAFVLSLAAQLEQEYEKQAKQAEKKHVAIIQSLYKSISEKLHPNIVAELIATIPELSGIISGSIASTPTTPTTPAAPAAPVTPATPTLTASTASSKDFTVELFADFLQEVFEIIPEVPGQDRPSVTSDLITKEWRLWYKKKYNCDTVPNKTAGVSGKTYALLKLFRNPKDHVEGLRKK